MLFFHPCRRHGPCQSALQWVEQDIFRLGVGVGHECVDDAARRASRKRAGQTRLFALVLQNRRFIGFVGAGFKRGEKGDA